MKRLLLAGLLVAPLALSRLDARADQDDAYVSLLGMAGSALSDRGPEAGEMPPDAPAIEARYSSAAASSAPDSTRAAVRSAEPAEKAAPRRERGAPGRGEGSPPVAAPPAPVPRVWTKVFATLLPPAARAASFEVSASTAPRRARPEAVRQPTPASEAGSAQGLLELVAAATAPSSPAR